MGSVIKEWKAATLQVTTLVPSGLWHPWAVAVDGSGNVYIADGYNNAIKEWSAATQQVTTLVSSGLSDPRGVAVDGSGNVYIADTANHLVKKWSAATQQVTTLVPSGLHAPYGLAVDCSGNLYIADINLATIHGQPLGQEVERCDAAGDHAGAVGAACPLWTGGGLLRQSLHRRYQPGHD